MLVPQLDLQTLDGAPAPWSEIWQKKNLLLLLAHDDCEECPRVLARWMPHLEAEEAVAVAIYTSPPEHPPEGVIALLDPEERMSKALGVSVGSAIAADRYFSIKSIQPVHELGPEAVSEDTIGWIDLAERTCDECGAPTW